LKKYSSRRAVTFIISLAIAAIASFTGWFFLKDLPESQLHGLDPNGFFSGSILMLIMIPILFLTINRQLKGKGRNRLGDSLAIKLRKPELKNLGYTKFFTRENYSRLS